MKKLYFGALLVMCVFILHACGGSSESDGSNTSSSTLSDEEIKNKAVENFWNNMDDSFLSAGSVSSDVEDTLTSDVEDTLPSDVEDPPDVGDTQTAEQPVNEPSSENDTESDDDNTRSLIASSMALGDETGERTTREGNRLTIDPDETMVCAEAGASNETQSEIERCETLVRDMTVVVDANTDTSGTVTYSYLDQEVINYAYSETTASLEVHLEGLKSLSDAEDALDPASFGETDSPGMVSGALRYSATTTNSTPGSEAGSIRLDVTRAINVESDNQESVSIGTGTLLSISADEAEESGRIELNVGEILINSSEDSNDDFDNISTDDSASDPIITRYDLKGLTAIIETGLEDDALVVQNLSIGRGPFRLYVNNELVRELSLDPLGFSIDNENDVITIDTDLNFYSLINETTEDGITSTDTLQTILEVMAPAGSVLLDQESGALKVLQGGPLSYTLTEPDSNDMPETTMVTVAAGQCFDDSAGPEEKPAIVDCD